MLRTLPYQTNRCLGTVKLVHDVVWLNTKSQIVLGVMSPWSKVGDYSRGRNDRVRTLTRLVSSATWYAFRSLELGAVDFLNKEFKNFHVTGTGIP